MGGAERVKPIRLYRKGRKIYEQPGVSLGGDRFLRRFGVGADRGRCVGFYEPLGESCTFRQDRESPGYRIRGRARAYGFRREVGYIDSAGKWVINPQFEDALNFTEGLAPVSVGGRWGYIDKTGKFAVNPQYGFGGLFQEGLASFSI